MQLITRVREAFHVDLPLARAVRHTDRSGTRGVHRVTCRCRGIRRGIRHARRSRATGTLPLSFAQQRLWFLDQLEPDSSAYNRTFAVRLTGPLNLEALEQSLREIVAPPRGPADDVSDRGRQSAAGDRAGGGVDRLPARSWLICVLRNATMWRAAWLTKDARTAVRSGQRPARARLPPAAERSGPCPAPVSASHQHRRVVERCPRERGVDGVRGLLERPALAAGRAVNPVRRLRGLAARVARGRDASRSSCPSGRRS